MKTARLGYFIKYHDGLNHVEPNKIGIESDFFCAECVYPSSVVSWSTTGIPLVGACNPDDHDLVMIH
jgi:hypothetical protein